MNRICSPVVEAARRLAGPVAAGPLDGRPDRELLDRFVRYAEHPAFEALLRRYAGLVWGVCRRALGRPADAEDAFQTVFLVLVRQARGVKNPDRLGPWLYGVAYRTALKARARQARLASRTEVDDMVPDPTPAADPAADWVPVLDRELAGLPAKYREPIVLCELQGLSRRDAAARLGVREGTLSSRLARGRDLLRRRLLKHGTLLPAAGVAGLVGRGEAVHADLLAWTADVTAGAVLGAAGAVPAAVSSLTDEVVKTMLVGKLRVAAVAALTAAALVGALTALGPAATPGPVERNPVAAGPADRGAEPLPAEDGPKPDPQGDVAAVQGTWRLDSSEAPKGFGSTFSGSQLIFNGERFWWHGPQSTYLCALKFDGAKNPKWMDLSLHPLTRTGDSHAPFLGIYRAAKDAFEYCICYTPPFRPAEFGVSEEPLVAVLRFKRAAPLPAVPDDQEDARRPLLGLWEMTSYASPSPRTNIAGQVGPGAMEFFRDRVVIAPVGLPGIVGTYTLDTTKKPTWIDITAEGDGKPKVWHGVIEADGDKVRLCFGEPDKRLFRPLDFDPKTAGRTVVELKRHQSEADPRAKK